MNRSIVEQRGLVTFPEFSSLRAYMLPVHDGRAPEGLAEWQTTLDQMLEGVEAPLAYLMIDQSVVQAGQAHRRPGVHIDGYWLAGSQRHGQRPGHGGHSGAWQGGSWAKFDLSTPEATILASSYGAARAYSGEWQGTPGEGGDCSHIDTDGMGDWFLTAGKVWAGNVAMLHESLPVSNEVARTLVRLTVPGWSPAQ